MVTVEAAPDVVMRSWMIVAIVFLAIMVVLLFGTNIWNLKSL